MGLSILRPTMNQPKCTFCPSTDCGTRSVSTCTNCKKSESSPLTYPRLQDMAHTCGGSWL